jgi:hypothetical protein
MSRADVKDLGAVIDDGGAALLVVGASTLQDAIDKADLKADKRVAKQLDVSTKDTTAQFNKQPKRSAKLTTDRATCPNRRMRRAPLRPNGWTSS